MNKIRQIKVIWDKDHAELSRRVNGNIMLLERNDKPVIDIQFTTDFDGDLAYYNAMIVYMDDPSNLM